MKYRIFVSCLFLAAVVVICGCGPRDGSKELEQGIAAYEVRDLKKAERLFEKSLQHAADDVDRIVYLARVKLDLGDLAATRSLIDQAKALSPKASDVMLLDAQTAWHLKDYSHSFDVFTALADDKGLSDEIRSQGCSGQGVVDFSRNNYHFARIAFFRAILFDRKNASAWYHLGCLYRDGFGYVEAARQQFEFFVRLEKMADMRVQKVQQTVIPSLKENIARQEMERPGASRRNSAACASALAKAESEWKKGAFKSARKLYQDALSADSLSYPAALGLAEAWMKTDTSKSGLNNAMDCYRTACALRPSAVSTYVKAGDLAMRLGLIAQATEIYSRAVAANHTSLEAIDGLIRALQRSNKSKLVKAYQQYRDLLAARGKK